MTSYCLNCTHEELAHNVSGDCGMNACDCPGFRDEPTDSEMSRGSRPVESFEGVGDFNGDPLERWQAHNAAKGR